MMMFLKIYLIIQFLSFFAIIIDEIELKKKKF